MVQYSIRIRKFIYKFNIFKNQKNDKWNNDGRQDLSSLQSNYSQYFNKLTRIPSLSLVSQFRAQVYSVSSLFRERNLYANGRASGRQKEENTFYQRAILQLTQKWKMVIDRRKILDYVESFQKTNWETLKKEWKKKFKKEYFIYKTLKNRLKMDIYEKIKTLIEESISRNDCECKTPYIYK